VSFLLVFLVHLGIRYDDCIVGFTDTASNIVLSSLLVFLLPFRTPNCEIVAGFSVTISYTEW